MSILAYFTQSFLIGFVIAASFGPIGMLCVRKTIEIGFSGAIAVGLGAALADGFYGFVAGAGLTFISNFLLEKTNFIKLSGGLLLLYMAYREFRSSPHKPKPLASKFKSLSKLTSQTFFLTLTNPLTILSFLGIFASIGGDNIDINKTVWMVLGIFIGSMFWWCILGKITLETKHYIADKWLYKLHYITAFILFIFGIYAIFSTLF